MKRLQRIAAGFGLALVALVLPRVPLTAQAPAARALAASVDSVFADLQRKDSPGCAVGVHRAGELVYANGYGLADLEHGIPITSRTVFQVGSIAKQFAAAAVVLLAEERTLSLDDDIRRYVPELPAFEHTVTIRHLLHHTSGLLDAVEVLELADRRPHDVMTARDLLETTVRLRHVNFAPGEEHLYNNTGYFLLSEIVHRASGRSLADFTSERFFRPLGMSATRFRSRYTELIAGRAAAYTLGPGGGYALDMPQVEYGGTTSLYTTVEDLARWDANFYEPQVGGRAWVDAMHARGQLSDGREIAYASGLVHGERLGLRTVEHGGSHRGYQAFFVRFPEQRLSVATLCNLTTAEPERRATAVAAVFLGDAVPAAFRARERAAQDSSVAPRLTRAQLQRYAGVYWNERLGQVLEVTVRGDSSPVLQLGSVAELRPRELGRFSLGGGITIAFGPPGSGPAEWLEAELPTPARLAYPRMASPPAERARWQEYEGTYRSDEVGAAWHVVIEADQLVLRRPRHSDEVLRPAFGDVFAVPLGTSMPREPFPTFRFVRDDEGRVNGFLFSIYRARNLEFSRIR